MGIVPSTIGRWAGENGAIPIASGPSWPAVGLSRTIVRDRHSPQQISGILGRMQPGDPTLQVSHETIYTALYAMPRGVLGTEFSACLRQARKSRRVRALRPPLARWLTEPRSSSH